MSERTAAGIEDIPANGERRASELPDSTDIAIDRRYGPLHLEIVRMLAIGMKNSEIARVCGVSTSLVSQVKHDPELRPLLQSMFDLRSQAVGNIDLRIAAQLKHIATKSLERLSDVLEPIEEDGHGGTNDAGLILAIARESLDRIGFGGGRLSSLAGSDAADELAANADKYDKDTAARRKKAKAALTDCVDVIDEAEDDLPVEPETDPFEGVDVMATETKPANPAGNGGEK